MIRFLFFLFVLSVVQYENTSFAKTESSSNSQKKSKIAVVRKNDSLNSIELLLKTNNNNNAYINELLLRIQNTKELLARMVDKPIKKQKEIKYEIEKFNSNMKEIVEQYNKLLSDNHAICEHADTEVEDLPKSKKATKKHAIITLDWRKKLRFDGIFNPIKELTSPLTEENVMEFIDTNKELDGVLEKKDIPDSVSSCSHIPVESAEQAISTIDEQKNFVK